MKSTLKILFADDDFKYSLVLKRFLEREGYEVTYTGIPGRETGSGLAGYQHARPKRFRGSGKDP